MPPYPRGRDLTDFVSPVGRADQGWWRRGAGVVSVGGSPAGGLECIFDAALGGLPLCLRTDDERSVPLEVRRWNRRAEGLDHWLLGRCTGPTVDIGCGPGRLVEALLARGISALGVDHSSRAGQACRDRKGVVLRQDIFAPIPDEGSWSHVLLADGNIGIGGDPGTLLRRCARLLAPGGSVLIELESPGTGLWRGRARLGHPAMSGGGPWFGWARVGIDALDQLAAEAGFRVDTRHHGDRCFADLRHGAGQAAAQR